MNSFGTSTQNGWGESGLSQISMSQVDQKQQLKDYHDKRFIGRQEVSQYKGGTKMENIIIK
jgi:hypothetical protein